MPRTSPRARTRATYQDEEGTVSRLVETALANPVLSGGLLVMVLTATAIVSNALVFQTGPHPEPLFVTRPEAPAAVAAPDRTSAIGRPEVAPSERPVAELVPTPRPKATPAAAASETPPVPKPAPVARRDEPAAADRSLVTDIQRMLADRGLYKGAIDGLMGSRTRAAIEAFEASIGARRTGEPSAGLLRELRQRSKPAETASVAPSVQRPPDPVPAATPALDARLQAVQQALNAIGYGPVPADGREGEGTRAAILRFQLDNGLDMNGLADEETVRKMVAIGAMAPL